MHSSLRCRENATKTDKFFQNFSISFRNWRPTPGWKTHVHAEWRRGNSISLLFYSWSAASTSRISMSAGDLWNFHFSSTEAQSQCSCRFPLTTHCSLACAADPPSCYSAHCRATRSEEHFSTDFVNVVFGRHDNGLFVKSVRRRRRQFRLRWMHRELEAGGYYIEVQDRVSLSFVIVIFLEVSTLLWWAAWFVILPSTGTSAVSFSSWPT